MREERKVVTALFADLVGSTALGETLDPEEAKLIMGEAIARMVRTVEEFGGTIKDLAGDGILALFGAPVAHEDDPERAIRTGLRIAQDIAEYGAEVSRAWGVPDLAVRVGVNSGPVVLGPIGAGQRVEYAAYGDTVNTAARLQSAAVPGTVLVGDATHRLVEPLFDWGGTTLTARDNVLRVGGRTSPIDLIAVYNAAHDPDFGTDAGWTPTLHTRIDNPRLVPIVVPLRAGAGLYR